jgi:hypothetical protein
MFRRGNQILRTCSVCREQHQEAAARRVAQRAAQRVLIPAARQWNLEDPSPLPDAHRCSPMNYECSHFGALHYLEEKLQSSSIRDPVFTLCCANGKVKLPLLQEPPTDLKNLLTVDTPSKFLFTCR